MAQPERGAPLLPPGLGIVLVVGPGEVVGQLPDHVVEVERRIEVVPAQDLQGREVAGRQRLGEMGERDPPLARVLGAARRRAFRDRHTSEDSAERYDWQAFRLELDEEDAPRLAGRQRTQSLDLLDLGRVTGVDPELRRGVLEGQVLEVGPAYRPVQLVAKERDQLVEAPDSAEALAEVGRWGQYSVRNAGGRYTGSVARRCASKIGRAGRSMRFITLRTYSCVFARRFSRISLWIRR